MSGIKGQMTRHAEHFYLTKVSTSALFAQAISIPSARVTHRSNMR